LKSAYLRNQLWERRDEATKNSFLVRGSGLHYAAESNVMSPASASPTDTINILIADDHPVVREGLVAIFKSQKDIKVVGEASDGEEACALCEQLFPDVLLLDLRMPKKDGLQVITELAGRKGPKPRIIVMTTYESEEDIRRTLKAGAKGYLAKGTAPAQIRDAVRRVAQGESLLPPAIATKLVESMARPELSERERQVLQYIANGRSNKEIGQVLYISENTVKAHVKSILAKLDAMGRTEAIAIATKRGLIARPE
jgi:DNA-binding NarL/FixJ family response regulator